MIDVDLAARRVALRDVRWAPRRDALEYDTLIVSGGSQYSYFGHDEWQEHAAELKSLEGALTIRRRILEAFEAAELEPDPERQAALLTFVVVGAGPTGVEMAGQIAEITRDASRRLPQHRSRDGAHPARRGRSIASSRPSRPASPPRPLRSLENLGVTGRLGESVVGVDDDSVTVQRADETTERIPTRTVIWAAGVTASPLARGCWPSGAGVEVDRAGRLVVEPDLSVPGHPEVLALGDMVAVRQADGSALVASRRRARGDAAGPPRARASSRDRLRRPRDRGRSTTPTRATSRPSGAPAPWPTSRACTSAASWPGPRGSWSTSGT